MKKSRFSEEQIIGILKQHEAGVKAADLCREHGTVLRPFMPGSRSSLVLSGPLSYLAVLLMSRLGEDLHQARVAIGASGVLWRQARDPSRTRG